MNPDVCVGSALRCLLTGLALALGLQAAPSWAAACPPSTAVPNLVESTPTADFEVHGNGTVTHVKTGLTWKQCAEGQAFSPGPPAACTNAAATMTWSEALGAAVSASFAGHTDWRLPNEKELQSIVEISRHSPSINQGIFPCTDASRFWSASTSPVETGAWNVSFDDGYVNGDFKTNVFLVRLVRGGNSVDPFDSQGDYTPDSFSFTARAGVALSTAVTSDTITVGGTTAVTPISIVGGTYSIGCVPGTFTAAPSAIGPGQSACVQQTSSANHSTSTTATLTIGGVSGAFEVTTAPASRSKPDFDGDTRADLFWRHAVTGQTYVWLMNALSVASAGSPYTVPDPNWTVVGAGDFDRDGKADVFWRHALTGQTAVWLMNGTSIASSAFSAAVPDLDWKVVGTGDFDGDGRTDLFWQHAVTGQTAVWLMNGSAIVSSGYSTTVPDWGWKVLGTGDFDGDGKADVFWHHSVTAWTYVWLMDGLAVASGGSPATAPDLGWKVLGTGDFDGDGKADVFWQHAATGETYVWLVDGLSVAWGGSPATVQDRNWKVVGVGDYDGDGKADVFWRHAVTGETYMWRMNGLSVAAGGYCVPVPDLDWKIENPK